MDIKINQITPKWEDREVTRVNVHFTARTEDGNINLSGNIPIDDFVDKINFDEIETEVKQELVDKIMNGEISAE